MKWLRSLRPDPLVEISKADAERMGVKAGDRMEISSPYGRIYAEARPTCKMKDGTVHMTHGYTEANVNLLIGRDHLDPYSGFPGFKGSRCNIQKCEEAK